MSENKTSKYFKYAIGEIILVVIGILIALQINNKNIENKERALESQYIASIRSDLQDDIATINHTISGNKELLDGLNTLLSLLAKPNLDKETKRQIFLYSAKYTYWYFNPEFSQVTLSQLKSSGDFQLIKNLEVTRGIASYSKGLEDCEHSKTEIKSYFHAFEDTQKSLLNQSLAKKTFEFIEENVNNMLAPLETFNDLINEGNFFLQEDKILIGRYYNDLLYYRTALNNLNVYISIQKELAESLITLIDSNYKIN